MEQKHLPTNCQNIFAVLDDWDIKHMICLLQSTLHGTSFPKVWTALNLLQIIVLKYLSSWTALSALKRSQATKSTKHSGKFQRPLEINQFECFQQTCGNCAIGLVTRQVYFHDIECRWKKHSNSSPHMSLKNWINIANLEFAHGWKALEKNSNVFCYKKTYFPI